MLASHSYDPGFQNCSPELKKVLSGSTNIPGGNSLDLPCGTGRNIFLLASHFKKVVGVDINQEYLNIIETNCHKYSFPGSSILTKKMDLMTEIPLDIEDFDFISTIHYYTHSLATRIIHHMKKGGLFYLETPSCAGGNYHDLPSEQEVASLVKDTEVILYKSRICQSPDSSTKSISFKILVRKPNG